MLQTPTGRRALALGLAFLCAISFAGCAQVRNNLKNTMADAMDMFRVDASFSLGTDMGAHVMATQFVQLKSYSYEDLYRVGIGTRSVGVWEEEREDWWVGPMHSRNLFARSKGVAVLSHALDSKMRSGRYYVMGVAAESSDEFGVGLHAFVLGIRAGIRPLEILDFLVSPVGVDICGDDKSLAQRRAEERARAQAEAATKAKEAGEEAPP